MGKWYDNLVDVGIKINMIFLNVYLTFMTLTKSHSLRRCEH